MAFKILNCERSGTKTNGKINQFVSEPSLLYASAERTRIKGRGSWEGDNLCLYQWQSENLSSNKKLYETLKTKSCAI